MPYRILTLDGGGAWAIIEVKALIAAFGPNARGNLVLEQFDMVAANSGGSIVLGGLVENLTLGELLDLFMDQTKRQMIFSPTHSVFDTVLETTLGVGPKYSAAAKLPALETLLPQTGNKPLSGITANMQGFSGGPLSLLIVGFDYDRNRAAFFRSQEVTDICLGIYAPPTITLAEAIHSSTNAPINYFDAPAIFPEWPGRYWDGGVSGFNNPVLAAVTEAVIRQIKPSEIAALSLGTGSVQLPLAPQGAASSAFTQPWKDSSLANDLTKMASSILDDPPDSASFIAHAMTLADGNFPAPAVSRIVRMNPLVAPVLQNGTLQAPGRMTPAQFQYLCNIGMDAVQQQEANAIAAYADLWLTGAAPNQLIHTNAYEPPFELGYHSLPPAVAAWQAISGMEWANKPWAAAAAPPSQT